MVTEITHPDVAPVAGADRACHSFSKEDADMALRRWLAAVLMGGASIAGAQTGGDDFPRKDSLEASVLRGEIVFRNYCALCHGVQADGRGRAARIYNPKPANLRESNRPDAYKEAIVRRGGKAMGRSEFMPPWGGELTDEQIADVVKFLRSIAPAK
jgi:mono/diheme cytochrome c family protein